MGFSKSVPKIFKNVATWSLKDLGIRKIAIFSNFVNFRPRGTIFTFLEFSAQAKKEYDKKCLDNWTSGASIVKKDRDWILIFIIRLW